MRDHLRPSEPTTGSAAITVIPPLSPNPPSRADGRASCQDQAFFATAAVTSVAASRRRHRRYSSCASSSVVDPRPGARGRWPRHRAVLAGQSDQRRLVRLHTTERRLRLADGLERPPDQRVGVDRVAMAAGGVRGCSHRTDRRRRRPWIPAGTAPREPPRAALVTCDLIAAKLPGHEVAASASDGVRAAMRLGTSPEYGG
jgi:hypothetical protein